MFYKICKCILINNKFLSDNQVKIPPKIDVLFMVNFSHIISINMIKRFTKI